jgi:hypothetical protein
MKTKMMQSFFLALAIAFFYVSLTYGREPISFPSKVKSNYNDFSIFTEEEYSIIEENLLNGIKSSNDGLKISSAYFLGEMKSEKSLIPLLKFVRNGATEEGRIIAGLSLYKIKSDIGMHLLKGLSVSDESQRVRNILSKIYNTYLSDNRTFSAK